MIPAPYRIGGTPAHAFNTETPAFEAIRITQDDGTWVGFFCTINDDGGGPDAVWYCTNGARYTMESQDNDGIVFRRIEVPDSERDALDLVEARNACPSCGEREYDRLVWDEDEVHVDCRTCGTRYTTEPTA